MIEADRGEPPRRVGGELSVAIVVPIRNELVFVEGCVRALLDQRDLPSRYEVLVVDGMSDDGTREILARLASQDCRLRVLDNPRRIVSTALNIGISATRSDVVIRVDGHARVMPDFVRSNLTLLRAHPEAWTVGGPIAHRGRTVFARGVALAMSSWFGGGSALHRREHFEGYAEEAPFPAIRREVFDKIGLFDEELVRDQDEEFCLRIIRAGGLAFISPKVRYEYYVREQLGPLFRQYLQYAYWKVQLMRKHRKVIAPRHLVPLVFAIALPFCLLGGLLLPAPLQFLVLTPPAAYAAAAGAFFLIALRSSGDIRMAASATVAATTMHVAYGSGTLVGLVAPPRLASERLRVAMERLSR